MNKIQHVRSMAKKKPAKPRLKALKKAKKPAAKAPAKKAAAKKAAKPAAKKAAPKKVAAKPVKAVAKPAGKVGVLVLKKPRQRDTDGLVVLSYADFVDLHGTPEKGEA